MPTTNQLCRYEGTERGRKRYRNQLDKALSGCPQKRGTCVQVKTMSPRKPNSACRRVARVRLSNNQIVTCYIRGIGHNLQTHSEVLIEGKAPADLPGVRHRIVRGVLGTEGVVNRKTSRSRYGRRRK